MALNGDDTRPGSPVPLRILKLEQRQATSDANIDSLDVAVKLMLARQDEMEERLTAQMTALRGDMRKGFDRLGELIDRMNDRHDRDYRRSEDSHHELEKELAHTKRIATMKTIAWPTAAVISTMLVCYCGLLALHIDVPNWLVGAVGVVGAAITGALPALLGEKQS